MRNKKLIDFELIINLNESGKCKCPSPSSFSPLHSCFTQPKEDQEQKKKPVSLIIQIDLYQTSFTYNADRVVGNGSFGVVF